MQTPKCDHDPESLLLRELADHPVSFHIIAAELKAALEYAGWMPIGASGLRPEEVSELLGRVVRRIVDHLRYGEDFALQITRQKRQ